MALFYTLAQLTAIARASYYIAEMIQTKIVAKAILTVLPGCFMLGMTISQLNIYVQLLLRLKVVNDNFENSF